MLFCASSAYSYPVSPHAGITHPTAITWTPAPQIQATYLQNMLQDQPNFEDQKVRFSHTIGTLRADFNFLSTGFSS